METWLSGISTTLYARSSGRRGLLGWLGRAAAGVAGGGMALTAGRPVAAAGLGALGQPPARPSGQPVLLPRGQRAAMPAGCGSCSGEAELVCTNCCAGGVCCPGQALFRQPCLDDNCQPYYIYFCV
jgi:hypothetical protein